MPFSACVCRHRGSFDQYTHLKKSHEYFLHHNHVDANCWNPFQEPNKINPCQKYGDCSNLPRTLALLRVRKKDENTYVHQGNSYVGQKCADLKRPLSVPDLDKNQNENQCVHFKVAPHYTQPKIAQVTALLVEQCRNNTVIMAEQCCSTNNVVHYCFNNVVQH